MCLANPPLLVRLLSKSPLVTHVLSNGPIGVVPRPVSIAPPRRKTNRRGPFQFQPGEGVNTPTR